MPNWATGCVTVTGKKESIASFIERFVSNDEPSTIEGKKYFARSFLEDYRGNVIEEIPEPKSADELVTHTFPVSFAWSAYSCVISGYPERFDSICITLSEACAIDGVDVQIQTIEYGMCFEEDIRCTATGELEHSAKDLRQVKCPACGEMQSISSFEEPEDCCCCECGEDGLVLVEMEDE